MSSTVTTGAGNELFTPIIQESFSLSKFPLVKRFPLTPPPPRSELEIVISSSSAKELPPSIIVTDACPLPSVFILKTASFP